VTEAYFGLMSRHQLFNLEIMDNNELSYWIVFRYLLPLANGLGDFCLDSGSSEIN
jgi:hypothetical protein